MELRVLKMTIGDSGCCLPTSETEGPYWLYISMKEVKNGRAQFVNITFDSSNSCAKDSGGILEFLNVSAAVKSEYAHFIADTETVYRVINVLFPNIDTGKAVDAKGKHAAAHELVNASGEPCAVCQAIYVDNVRVPRFGGQVRCWQHCY